jgi:hypothetical protein
MIQSSPRGPLVLKTLEDYRVWPVKHRHWIFEVVEDENHQIWIKTQDLRFFYENFPSDKALKAVSARSMIFAKDTKSHYLAYRAVHMELRKSKNHSSHSDVLKFLDWFERNVTQVATKKRSNLRLDEANDHRQHHESKISDGPIPIRLAPPQLDEPTVPFTKEERWAMEQSSEEVRRVFHPDARPIRTTWREWARTHLLNHLDYSASFWRGERNLFWTFCAGLLVALVPQWIFGMLVPDSLDWTTGYKRVMWAYALMVPISAICATLFVVSMTRSTRHAWRLPAGKIWATAFYLLVIPVGPWIFMGGYDGEMLEYWWASVRGQYEPINVYADPHLGRIVVKGPMNFGSADAFQAVLDKNPKFTLVQIESPGGFVLEGMRMAQVTSSRKLDTVSMERCASACTFVLAAGSDRYLGPDAKVGFHRSGTRYGPVGSGWNETDHQIAKYYRDRGVNEAFVNKALEPSIRQIWFAPHADMYTAGYATLMWSERKTGY